MAERPSDDNAPATAMFPQFESELYAMVDAEVNGLTDEQLGWESERWEWSKWSIRRQVSHIAFFMRAWLITRWGEQLFPQGLSELGELADFPASPDQRWLEESKYRELPDLLTKVDESMRLAQLVLASETVGSMARKEIPGPDSSPLWSQLANAHPVGMRRDDENPNSSYITLEATFRHMYYEVTTHLYNIQRLKRAQGLAAAQEIPFEGYWALPDWDRSEP